jgi:hypothetical protein
MNPLYTYLTESIEKPKVSFSTDDLMSYGVWTPNDDLTKEDCQAIVDGFNKKFPNGEILGCKVNCRGGNDIVVFNCEFGSTMDTVVSKRVKIIMEILNLLTNTVYSVMGGEKEINRLTKRL